MDPDLGGPKTCGSGSLTLFQGLFLNYLCRDVGISATIPTAPPPIFLPLLQVGNLPKLAFLLMIITINVRVPVDYVARGEMIFMWALSITRATGRGGP
jgi:hypothetical protein